MGNGAGFAGSLTAACACAELWRAHFGGGKRVFLWSVSVKQCKWLHALRERRMH